MEEVHLKSRVWDFTWKAAILFSLLIAFRTSKIINYFTRICLYLALNGLVSSLLLPILLLRPFSIKNMLLISNAWKPLSRIFDITWEMRGATILQAERKGVIVANHQSFLDFIGMTCVWQHVGNCAMTTKLELFYYGSFGLALWLSGVAFLDRRRPSIAWSELKKASRRALDEQFKLWLFPEGTRNFKGKTLLPFKKGAFLVAIAGQVPILPVVFAPYQFVDEGPYELPSGRMVVQALAPIPTRGLTKDDLEDLMETTRGVIQTAFDALSAELRQDLDAPRSSQRELGTREKEA